MTQIPIKPTPQPPPDPKVKTQRGNIVNESLASVWQVLIDMTDSVFASLQHTIGIKGMAYFFVLPNLLIFSIFILFPMLLNFNYAVTGGIPQDDNIFLNERPYVGTQNFEELFNCEDFFEPSTCETEDDFPKAVMNTALFVITQVALMVVMSLITALALNRPIILRGFFRAVFFFPVLLSPIVVALIWKWILQERGLLNALLGMLGVDPIVFLIDRDWARIWVVIISVWALMGFYTLILLAGLQSIPSDLYEASSIDGANSWQAFWQITLPLLMPTLLVVLVLSLIRAVQVFDVVFAFTGGGPGTATTYMVQYIFNNGFAAPVKQYGIAAAASLLMGIVLVISTLVQLWLQNDGVKKTRKTPFPSWIDIAGIAFIVGPLVWRMLGGFAPELIYVIFGLVAMILCVINFMNLRQMEDKTWERAGIIIFTISVAQYHILTGIS